MLVTWIASPPLPPARSQRTSCEWAWFFADSPVAEGGEDALAARVSLTPPAQLAGGISPSVEDISCGHALRVCLADMSCGYAPGHYVMRLRWRSGAGGRPRFAGITVEAEHRNGICKCQISDAEWRLYFSEWRTDFHFLNVLYELSIFCVLTNFRSRVHDGEL